MNKLILTVGLPGSGKTTWAREQNCPIVQPDAIRLAVHGQRFRQDSEPMVWAIAKTMVRSLFLAGHHTVILDATNGTRKRRLDWLDTSWVNRYADFQATPEECKARCLQRDGTEEIFPVIDRMADEWEYFDEDESRWVIYETPR